MVWRELAFNACEYVPDHASYDSLPTSFASLEEATRWRNAYADAYQRTVSFLAANDSGARQVGTR